MSIYDRARDALKPRQGDDHEKAKGYGILTKYKEPFAAAVVRAADLADELDESRQTRARTIDRSDAAALIRDALENKSE